MSQWKPVCRIDDIPVLGSRRVARPGHTDIAIFRTGEDKIYALLDRCPHKGGPLSQGIVFGESVACPLHNWTIELGSGCARAPDEGCVMRFSVQLEDRVVALDLDEINSPEATASEQAETPGSNDAATSNVDHPARR